MIIVHLADGFEEVEAVTIIDLLRRAGLDVTTVSIMERKEITGAHDIRIEADTLFEDVDYRECEMMVLPGGGVGSQNLDAHYGVTDKLKEFNEKGKWIAAICAAPMILGHHGIFNGQKATIYRGMEAELKGAEYVDEKVVVDGHIITSQGPATAMNFALKIISVIKGEDKADEIADALLF